VALELLAAASAPAELAPFILAVDRTLADEAPAPEVAVETLGSAEGRTRIVGRSVSELETAARMATAVTEVIS
jgi:hypothetical protein